MSRHRRNRSGISIILDLIADCIIFFFQLCWKIITLPFWIYKRYQQKKHYTSVEPFPLITPEPITTNEKPLYRRKYLLTKHEWTFYQSLKKIADELGYIVLAKIRMADLVEPIAPNNSEYYRAFGKVKAKHVDFALARKENMYVELLIELDDRSHIPGNERDAFVEYVYTVTGYKLLRYWDGQDLRQMIINALNITPQT